MQMLYERLVAAKVLSLKTKKKARPNAKKKVSISNSLDS